MVMKKFVSTNVDLPTINQEHIVKFVTGILFTRVARICVALTLTFAVSNSVANAAIDAFNNDRIEEAKLLFSEQLENPESKDSALYHLAEIDQLEMNYDEGIESVNKAIAIGK